MIPKLLYRLAERMVFDSDSGLVGSDLEEYYLDNGAVFTVQACLTTEIAQNGKLEVELFGETGVDLVRVFHNEISTLANKFITVLYELPKRTTAQAGTEGTDWRDAHIFYPNRINIKTFPLDIAVLLDGAYNITKWLVGTEYSTDDLVRHNGVVYKSLGDLNTGNEPPSAQWAKEGDVVDIRQFLLESKGGQQAADAGAIVGRATIAELNTADYNYLFELQNLDLAKEFGESLIFGVPSLV